MYRANELRQYQQNPAWNLPDLNPSLLLQPGHHIGVPSISNASLFAANAVAPGRSIFSCLPDFNAANQTRANGLFSTTPTKNWHLNDPKLPLPNVFKAEPTPTDVATAQKRFLIFDQSGNQTRFFFSQGLPNENEIILSKKPLVAYGSCYENPTALVEQGSPVKPIIEYKLDGSYANDVDSEIHEDTEEINALLYSDETDEEADDDGVNCEDDEVTSTGRSPCANQGAHNEHEQHSEELGEEEVASCDGACKRQRLLDERVVIDIWPWCFQERSMERRGGAPVFKGLS